MSDQSNQPADAEDGPLQFELPRRIEVARFGSVGGAGGTVYFRLLTPDARLLQKLTLLAVSTGTAPSPLVLAGRGLTLWLYTAEKDQVWGKQYIPVTDLAGSTSAAPINLPANAALGGFSREFVTSADAIEGRITIPVQAPAGTAGSLYLQARYQPAAFRLVPWSEWDNVRQQTKIELVGRSGPLVVP